jgi:hypothetical protein
MLSKIARHRVSRKLEIEAESRMVAAAVECQQWLAMGKVEMVIKG